MRTMIFFGGENGKRPKPLICLTRLELTTMGVHDHYAEKKRDGGAGKGSFTSKNLYKVAEHTLSGGGRKGSSGGA